MLNNVVFNRRGIVVFCFFLLMMLPTGRMPAMAGQYGYSTSSGTLGVYQKPQQKDGTGKKLLAVYVVGSDLESYDGAATTDFNEMIAGYNTLSKPGVIDIIIAFGGADRSGWRGMRFATIDQLVQDGTDGRYGDETGGNAYLYKAENAHMGDQSALQQFLEYVKEGYADYDVSALVFWDHGASYGGFGNDENFNYDELTLTEIQNSLGQSGVGKFDMIGFDACLMGSVEVARFIHQYATYLLASEESEPGHGWNWTSFIKQYALRDNITNAMKNSIDNFVSNNHEYQSDGKTLSAVKLDKFNAVSTALETFAVNVADNIASSDDYKDALIHAVTNVRDFGVESREDDPVSVDLKDLVKKFRDKVSNTNARQLCYALLVEVNDYIYYSRQDGTRPKAYGISIAPVQGAVGSQADTYMVNTGWIKLQNAYARLRTDDTTGPTVEDYNSNANSDDYDWDDDWHNDWNNNDDWDDDEWDDDDWDDYGDDGWGWYYDDWYFSVIESDIPPFLRGERAAFVPNGNYLRDVVGGSGVKGVSATFFDKNLARATTIFGFELDYGRGGTIDSYFLSVAEMEAYPTKTRGQYFTPAWNKKWYTVGYDANASTTEWMPMVFQQRYTTGEVTYTEYMAEIDYYQAGKDYSGYDFPADYAVLRIVVDENNQVADHFVQTYKILYDGPDDEYGRVQFDKVTRRLQVGDKIQFWTYGFHMTDPEKDDWFETSEVITLTKTPEFGVETLAFEDDDGSPLTYKYAMWAEDASKNGVLTTPAAAGDETAGNSDNGGHGGGGGSCFIDASASASISGAGWLLLGLIFPGALVAIIKPR